MNREIPVFRRCCFCLPLRYGLLAWGYFKLIVDALIIALLLYSLIFTLMMTRGHVKEDYTSRMYTEIIISIVAIAVFFTDLIVTIVFIVGGHKKNVQLIRIFYFLSMGMWVVSFLLAATSLVASIQNLITFKMYYWIIYDLVINISFYFLVLVVQTYFLLLLRSEIIKLRNNGQFRFVNNAAEAECTMNCEKTAVGEEPEKEGVRDSKEQLNCV